jgi:hypothetical protein
MPSRQSPNDPATGRLRSEQFEDAVRRGDAANVVVMLQRFEYEQKEGYPIREPGQWQPRPQAPTFTREQIKQNYRRHQKGEWVGREAEWDRLEGQMIRAAAAGLVPNAVPLAKNHGDGR